MFCCILYKHQIISEFFDFLGYLLFEGGDVFSKKYHSKYAVFKGFFIPLHIFRG